MFSLSSTHAGHRIKPTKHLSGIVILACLVLIESPHAQSQSAPVVAITRSGTHNIIAGPPEHFSGAVHIQPLFDPHDPSRTVGASVTFEPGARTVWHTHPLGQTLIVTDGTGWIQQWGGPIQEIQKGDVVWIPAGIKHWHGATATSSMTHIAITEVLRGKAVDWLEKVSDQQYGRR